MFIIWAGFILLIFFLLALDLGVFHRKAHVISVKEALGWSAFWITLGLLFSIFIYYGYENHWLGLGNQIDPVDGLINNGKHATIKYITGYIVEKSLSVDNIFVIVMVFNFFAVPPLYQHRVLFWGVLGALVMRGGMIAIGATLVAEFHWVLYIFGAFLIFTAIRMLLSKEEASDPHDNLLVRLVRKIMPVTSHYHGTHFAVRAGSNASHESETPDGPVLKDDAVEHEKSGVWMLTPLALSLVVVETTDLIFAVDSIPAIFAITADPFIVFTSNVFAILGLRSLYFALAGMVNKFRYLKAALSAVLFVVGVKMLIADYLREWLGSNFNFYLLGVVALILAIGVVASLLADNEDKKKTIEAN